MRPRRSRRFSLHRRALLWIAIVLALPAGAVDGPSGTQAIRNLLVISIDTLRADRLGCYGHDRPTSPMLDRLAARGLLFEDASATSPWTKPSHASLFTGLYPGRHGATATHAQLSSEVRHLAEWLAERGYETAAVVNSDWLASHGLERGFEAFRHVPYEQGRRAGSGMTGHALAWFRQRDRTKPFFAFVHYMDVHSDYTSLASFERKLVRGGYEGAIDGTTQQLYAIAEGKLALDASGAEHLRQLYDAGIRQVDDQLGGLLGYLEKQGLLGSTLVVVTSDHGEEFLDHGSVLHGKTQYREVVRVPLILHGPGIPEARIAAPVSLVDVMPTVLRWLGVAPSALDGVALQPLWERPELPPAARLLYFEADVTFPPPGPGPVPVGPLRAVRSARFKLHHDLSTGTSELYDLREDPTEQVNRIHDHPETARVLLGRLRDHLARPAAPETLRELSDEQLRSLRSLGYLGGE